MISKKIKKQISSKQFLSRMFTFKKERERERDAKMSTQRYKEKNYSPKLIRISIRLN